MWADSGAGVDGGKAGGEPGADKPRRRVEGRPKENKTMVLLLAVLLFECHHIGMEIIFARMVSFNGLYQPLPFTAIESLGYNPYILAYFTGMHELKWRIGKFTLDHGLDFLFRFDYGTHQYPKDFL